MHCSQPLTKVTTSWHIRTDTQDSENHSRWRSTTQSKAQKASGAAPLEEPALIQSVMSRFRVVDVAAGTDEVDAGDPIEADIGIYAVHTNV
jgi:hypothetical protein